MSLRRPKPPIKGGSVPEEKKEMTLLITVKLHTIFYAHRSLSDVYFEKDMFFHKCRKF
jgi:hypothetical protein